MTCRHSKVTYRMTVYTSSSSSMNNPLIVSSTNINYKLYVCRLVPPPTTVCFHRLSFSGALKPPARNISNSTFKFHSTNNRRVTAKQTTPLARRTRDVYSAEHHGRGTACKYRHFSTRWRHCCENGFTIK